MGDTKLCLLLLGILVLAYAQDIESAEEQPTCLLAKRYKAFHKYEYQYEAESLNAINGASQLRNGPKTSCKVEIEVPQACSYILRTTGCSLSEVVDTDAEGNPVFGSAATSDAFAAAMEKNPLKVVVEGVYDVKLYPEEDESITILNIKRGIISALAVPLLEEDKNKKLPTIHGLCKTSYSVNAREDIATDITITRDLSKCDNFIPQKQHTSPLALISGMHYPLAQLIRSSQTCNYKFDNENKHMTSGACTENHILVPFSHNGEYGVTNIGKQSLTLLEESAYNDRIFDHNEANLKFLPMEAAEDKSAVQDKDAALAILRELATLSQSNNGEKRAHLFQKLVSMVRVMKSEILSPAIPEALEVSGPLTYQVLAQCGTPECSSAIMQILRTFDDSSIEVDAAVFTMGLLPNPSALLVNDMLAMAQYKQSKTIMYALSNAVKSFYKAEGKLTPEIHSVAEFMATQLGDCSGDKEQTFMILRVIGNMATAIGAASPALRTAVIQCVNQADASPEVQQAAIQVYRLAPVPEEGREVLMQVLLDHASPLQKRIAAYLVLMKDPQPSELAQLGTTLPNERNQQLRSFIISHLTNILESTEPETQQHVNIRSVRTRLRDQIFDALLLGNDVGNFMDPTKFSRNYKIGSVEGNMIFDGTSYLPQEVILEMTLKALGFDVDIMEVGFEGKGLEPSVDALFGEDGFFPDTALKTMYFVSDKMPLVVSEVLRKMLPPLNVDRKKASQNLMREISRNLNKVVRELKNQESPETMVYLRLLGNELGYLKTKDMEEMAYSAVLMIDNMIKMFSTDLIKGLMTKEDNEVFAHYIFMDNEFFLPTATGVPLRIALQGTFTPGVKGGLSLNSHHMTAFSFMPSVGVEFVTEVGSHIPEYVMSGLEMHTNLYHESGLQAKIAMPRSQVIKLTIPTPQSPTKLISITNSLVAVTTAEVKTIPPMVEDRVYVDECSSVIAGIQYCTVLQYTDASSQDTAPYFPFTGDSKFSMELHPTSEVSQYSATISYELLREGNENHDKVDSVQMVLTAEGAEPTKATATVKYNRRKHVLTTDIQIPDYDLEAGLRLGVVDGNTKGKGTHSISLDLINKNIPQLSLVGRAKIEAMKEAMLQVQLLVPSLNTDATVTATLKRDEELELVLESDIKLPETTSVQKISLKYDDSKIEAEVKSEMNSEIHKTIPQAIGKLVNDVLDMQVGQADTKFRHILTKSVEATNNYLVTYAADIPYMQNLKVPTMPEVSLPENMFLNVEAKAAYHFSDQHISFSFPIPLGGKSTEELNFPTALTTPSLYIPQFGFELNSVQIPIPELYIPEVIAGVVPLFGKAEVSTHVHSNLYDLEASASAGKDDVETPSYSARFDVTGSSQVDILSIKIKGSGLLASPSDQLIKAQLMSSVTHTLIDASISIMEVATVADKINVKSSSKIEVTSPLGLNVALEHAGLVDFKVEAITAESNLEGTVKAGPVNGKATATQSFVVFPFRPEAKIDSSLEIDSTLFQAKNTLAATFASGELSVESNSNILGMTILNKGEASARAGTVSLKMETNADCAENRIYSLVTASLDDNGLAVNSDANVKLFENDVTHKATLTMNKDGLATSGKTNFQGHLVAENTISVGLDASKASLSINSKAALEDMMVDNANSLTITLSNLAFTSKADAFITDSTSYTHDIAIDLQPYTASVKVNNGFKLMEGNLVNEAQLKAELYKIDITGSLKAVYNEEVITHTYEMNYADLTANANWSTTGELFETQMSHKTELEVVGLGARFNNDVRFKSRPVRFDHIVHASVIPYNFNLDAIFTADGAMNLFGIQSSRQGTQLYGKFLLKAQPLALASSHEYRASFTLEQLDDYRILDTKESTIDNKLDTLITPQEQKVTFRFKSKVNDHALNQEVNAYNDADRLGVEVSGTMLTDLLNTDASGAQEYTISSSLKYDKNTNSRIIQLPLIQTLPAILETIRIAVQSMAEALQNHIMNEATFVALPQHVIDFFTQLNLEGTAVQLKQYLISQEYAITMEELEASLENLRVVIEKLFTSLTSCIQGVIGATKEMIVSGTLSEKVMQRINQELNTITEEYDINSIIVAVINAIDVIIKQIDMENIEIKARLEQAVSELKHFMENFDRSKFVEDLRHYISSINIEAHVEQLMAQIPTQTLNMILDAIKNVIQEIDVIGNFNVFHRRLNELIVKLEVHKTFEAILEKVLELIQRFKIDESVALKTLHSIDIHSKVMQILEAIYYLGDTEIKDVVMYVNEYSYAVQMYIKTFNHNSCVDAANKMISKYTTSLNEVIKALEIPQKSEAIRTFVNFIVSSVMSSVEQLREIKVVDMIKSVKEFVDLAMLNDLKALSESLKQKISEVDMIQIEIQKIIIEILDFIINFDIPMTTADAFFGDLRMNYMPTLPEMILPEIIFPEISFPALPNFPVEKLLEIPTLQIPEFKMPTISSEVLVPCFGKLYGEFKVNTPIYIFKTSAEFQNATTNAKNPQFTASLTSNAISPGFEILNYNLDSTVRVAFPKLSRVIVSENVKFTHSVLAVEHQASVTLYGLSAQASAKTKVKATTAPYTGDIVNNAFFAMDEGVSASSDTTYNHQINIEGIYTGFAFSSEASLTQKAVVRQEGFTVIINIGHEGSEQGPVIHSTHKSELKFNINPSTIKLTFSADTNTDIVHDRSFMKMKQMLSVDGVTLSYLKFDARSVAEGELIKKSLAVASGHVNLGDMRFELKAKHDTELVGEVSGILSNAINVLISPAEFIFDLQNKATAKLNNFFFLHAKIELQNDYSATVKPDVQKFNTMAHARFDQYKSFYNFTIENNEKETSIYSAVDGEANLAFLNEPISIPEMDLLLIETPEISDLNLYEYTGMKHIFTTTENVGVDAKIVYQKSNFAPILNMGQIRIPSLGNLITELSFKSSIINLNANAGLNAEDDLVFHLGVTSSSVFEALKAKLDATTSLTNKRGLKLATALSLENSHIEGTLDSRQQFVADTNHQINAASTLKLKGVYKLPLIVGKAEVDHSLKLDGTLEHISMETYTKGNVDGTILESSTVLVILDNEANIYLNADGMRSTSKIIANAKLNNDDNTILEIDVDENLAVEASLSHVYANLKFTSNNEANWRKFTTNGKHVAQATIDLAPSSLITNVEIDMSQPSFLGDIAIFEKISVELSGIKQKISSTSKMATPVYTTNLALAAESVPGFKAKLKSSATSPIVFLEYDMDGSIHITENEEQVLSMTNKFILTHTDLSVDIQEVLTEPLRKKRQAEGSLSRHTLNVDITSPTFTDVNFRYASRKDGFSASISTPSTGFLGLQLQGRTPSQLNAKLYNRYASAPGDDVEILTIRASVKEADKMNLQVVYNMEAPSDMLHGLKNRLPAVTSTLTNFADKYEIPGHIEGLRSSIVADGGGINYAKIYIYFRDIVQNHETISPILDDVGIWLRETKFTIPGDEDMSSLHEIISGIAEIIQEIFEEEDGLLDFEMLVDYVDLLGMLWFEDVDFVDNVKETIGVYLQVGRDLLNQIAATLNLEQLNSAIDYIMDMLLSVLSQFNNTISAALQQASEEVQAYAKVNRGRLEINLPFSIHQGVSLTD